jgi:hypothetical protein
MYSTSPAVYYVHSPAVSRVFPIQLTKETQTRCVGGGQDVNARELSFSPSVSAREFGFSSSVSARKFGFSPSVSAR